VLIIIYLSIGEITFIYDHFKSNEDEELNEFIP